MSAARTIEQLTLPGQVAAPAGPVDMAGMFLMHHGFRRDLDNFVLVVPMRVRRWRSGWSRLGSCWPFGCPGPASCGRLGAGYCGRGSSGPSDGRSADRGQKPKRSR
jgi:hypothetical protein